MVGSDGLKRAQTLSCPRVSVRVPGGDD